MKEYRRQTGVIKALQWTGVNQKELKQFCPKVSFQIIFDEDGDFEDLYLLKEGKQVFVPKGDYVIKEDGTYYSYPKSLFKKHYLEIGNRYQAQCDEAIRRIKSLIQSYQLDIQIESYWDEEMECYFIHHDEMAFDQLEDEALIEGVAQILGELFYSQGIYQVAFGFDYEFALRTGKMECPHQVVELIACQNVGLEPRYNIICSDCGKALSTAILEEQAVELIRTNEWHLVAGQEYLENEEEDEC